MQRRNPTLERLKDVVIDLLDDEGLSMAVNGCWVPGELARHIADKLNALFYCKGWTVAQAHCLEQLLRKVITQAKIIGRELGEQRAERSKSRGYRDPSGPVGAPPAQS